MSRLARFGARIAIAGLLLVPPLVLSRLTEAREDWPHLRVVWEGIRSGYVDPRDVVFVLIAGCWVAWLYAAICTIAELAAALHLPAWHPPAGGLIRPLVLSAVITVSAARPAGAATLPARPVATLAASPLPPAVDREPPPTVTVRPGDTLWDLARRHLGDPYRWRELVSLNQPLFAGADQRALQPGWALRLPTPVEGTPSAARLNPPVAGVAAGPARGKTSQPAPLGTAGLEWAQTPSLGTAGLEIRTRPTVDASPTAASPHQLGTASVEWHRPAADDRPSPMVAAAFAGVGGAITAAGVAAALGRRRAAVGPVEPVVAPDVEFIARHRADPDPQAIACRALAALAVPAVAVAVTPDRVDLGLASTLAAAPAPFCLAAMGKFASANVDDLPLTSEPLPSVVPLGTCDATDHPLFLPIVPGRRIGISGPKQTHLLRTLAIHLDGMADIDLLGIGPDLHHLDGLTATVVDDESAAHRWLADRDRLTRPLVALATVDLVDGLPDQIRQLDATLIAPRLSDADITITLTWDCQRSRARLEQLMLDFEPAYLADDLLAAAGAVLAEVTHPKPPPPTPEPADGDVIVRLHGEPAIVGSAERITQPKTIELIAYIALHPDGVSGERLRWTLWPDGPDSDHAFHQAISHARRQLGRTAEGALRLPHVTHGVYRLSGVTVERSDGIPGPLLSRPGTFDWLLVPEACPA